MPRYRVDVCRIAYGNRDLEVEAKSPKQAMRLAEEKAGSFDFTEHTSEYKAQSCILHVEGKVGETSREKKCRIAKKRKSLRLKVLDGYMPAPVSAR